MRLALLPLAALWWSGCAPRQYSLFREGNRDVLLPPGMRKAPAGAAPATECLSGVPTSPRASHFALYGCYVETGFVDLQPGMRLKIVKPMLPKGKALETEIAGQEGLNLTVRTNALGVDTQFLDVLPRRGEGVSVDVGVAPGITHYRLFFLARDLDQGRKITLIGARSTQELEAAAKDLEAYCARAGAPCLAPSAGTVIGAQVAVTVQGRREFFPLGATVREVAPADKDRLRLTRLWHGRAAPVKATGPGAPSILSLPLNGGDSIVW